jgi:hypothetical protein
VSAAGRQQRNPTDVLASEIQGSDGITRIATARAAACTSRCVKVFADAWELSIDIWLGRLMARVLALWATCVLRPEESVSASSFLVAALVSFPCIFIFLFPWSICFSRHGYFRLGLLRCRLFLNLQRISSSDAYTRRIDYRYGRAGSLITPRR